MSRTDAPNRQLDKFFPSFSFWHSLFKGLNFLRHSCLCTDIEHRCVSRKIKSSTARTEHFDVIPKSTGHDIAKKLLHADLSTRGQFHLNLPLPTYDPLLK